VSENEMKRIRKKKIVKKKIQRREEKRREEKRREEKKLSVKEVKNLMKIHHSSQPEEKIAHQLVTEKKKSRRERVKLL
jgi:hypothetical protein